MTNTNEYTSYREDRELLKGLGLDRAELEQADRALFFGKLQQVLDKLGLSPKELTYLEVEHAEASRMCQSGLESIEDFISAELLEKQKVIEAFLVSTLYELDFSPELEYHSCRILRWHLDLINKSLLLDYKLFDARDYCVGLLDHLSGLLVTFPTPKSDDCSSIASKSRIFLPTISCHFVDLSVYTDGVAVVEYLESEILKMYPTAYFRKIYYSDLIYCEDVPPWEIDLDWPKHSAGNWIAKWSEIWDAENHREKMGSSYIFNTSNLKN